jgi:Porin subfamily
MTLIKSLLLGSAAGIVAVASAQAADLPTRKAAPVEYVKVCNVGGITGWTLPGSDTCVKFSGYITAQFVAGNLTTQYNYGTVGNLFASGIPGVGPTIPGVPTGAAGALLGALGGIDNRNTQRVLVAASAAQQNTTFYRSNTGWSTRANFGFDMASNTPYGPLIGHFDINVDAANGLDPLQYGATPNIAYLNTGYLTWAGITAGKAQSFFSFTGGGDNFANFFSPDRKGFNEPYLLAYTASFGGGFSATISAETPWTVGASGGGTDLTGGYFNTNSGPQGSTFNPTNITFGGQKWPDIVGALHVKQGWGEAQISGVIHNVNVIADGYDGSVSSTDANPTPCGVPGAAVVCNGLQQKVGWALDAGIKVNLPWFGAGDDALLTGAYSQSAVWYSGLADGMWTDNGAVNGNGQPMWLADAFFNPVTNQWSSPRAWSVSGLFEHHFTPQFYLDLEGSIGGLNWSNMGGGCNFALPSCLLAQAGSGAMSPHLLTWIAGFDLGWNPVTNLNFDLELMYQGVTQAAPSGFIGTVYNYGQSNEFFVPGDWKGNSDGLAGRLRITRYF